MRLLLMLFVVSIADLTFAQEFVATTDQKEQVRKLLDQSLEDELAAIADFPEEANWNTVNSFMTQIDLRGRAGKAEQIGRITNAIAARHEDRNLDRSKTKFNALTNRYENLNSTLEGLHDLIIRGNLDDVFETIRSESWGAETRQPERDLLDGEVAEGAKQLSILQLDKFWVACRLACAYHAQGDTTQVRTSLNFVRSVLEGDHPTGKEFDADLDWLPPDERSGGFSAVRQHRSTLQWTLVQSGFAELGIKLFKKDVAAVIAENIKKKNGAEYWSGDLSGQIVLPNFNTADRLAQFAAVVVKHVSPRAATNLVQELFPDRVPLKVNVEMVKACLEVRADAIAIWHLDQVVNSLASADFETSYHHRDLLDILVKHRKLPQANRLTLKLIERIEKIDAAMKAVAKTGTEQPAYVNHQTWAHLAQIVVEFNQDAAFVIEPELLRSYGTRSVAHSGGKKRAEGSDLSWPPGGPGKNHKKWLVPVLARVL